ncbi:hypothetical protein HDG35_007587 [Paraburkholderia sp. JPY681]|uniref:YCII-related protein n=1 Tax=Paraburkholderia atlantica TaxID=2654982 RepID=D5WLF6_PARAM|nr:YCII-related protein [Paraburkholderia atlantica]MBB5511285.1 hypothetical protein [Paraburkholderia atlantica]
MLPSFRTQKTDAGNKFDTNLPGPTLAPQCDAMNGTLLVVEAERIDDVMEFVSIDPYMKAGLFDCVEIRPWDWSLGNPERRV